MVKKVKKRFPEQSASKDSRTAPTGVEFGELAIQRERPRYRFSGDSPEHSTGRGRSWQQQLRQLTYSSRYVKTLKKA
jgi:hypothetical protein